MVIYAVFANHTPKGRRWKVVLSSMVRGHQFCLRNMADSRPILGDRKWNSHVLSIQPTKVLGVLSHYLLINVEDYCHDFLERQTQKNHNPN